MACAILRPTRKATRDGSSLRGLRVDADHGGGRRGAVDITWTPESFWRLFEATGSIWAYLIYRQLTGNHAHWVVPILN
jgi:hypothetical protein